MANGYDENYVGEAALKKGFITPAQLDECKALRQRATSPKSLARVLSEKGYLDEEQMGEILKEYQLAMGQMLPDDTDPGSINFGQVAVRKGLVSNADVWDAIEEQARRKLDGSEERLGQILVEKGTIQISEARQILESQGKKILKCAECGHQYNVKEFNPNKEYTCLNCGGPLSAPETVSSLDIQGTAVDTETVKASMDDRFIGKEIGGCEIMTKLGEGGMGSVYKARHLALNKIVAVKVMSNALMGEIHRKRFLREARAAAQLEHMNIIQVHDTGAQEGYNYIVMQFIDGQSVQKMISTQGRFEQKEALRVIHDAADALAFAHKRHMIHRDIKPDNIMLTSEGVVKVADFGLVKSTEIEKDLTGMSQSMLMGTPHYMSPEQFEGKIIDHRTDIYSLGVTLYYMLTGQKPYEGTTPYQVMQGHLQQELVDPSNLAEDIYPAVSQIVKKMMARERERRYPSCEEIEADIDKVHQGMKDGTIAADDFIIVEDDLEEGLGATMQAAPPPKEAAPRKPRKKKSVLPVVIPAIVFVAIVMGLLAFLLTRGPSAPPVDPNDQQTDTGQAKPDMKEAQIAFESTKKEANKLVDQDEFAAALGKWEGFVKKWGEDPWKEKVDIERGVILDAGIRRLKELLASNQRSDLEKAAGLASKLKDLQPDNEQLASVASEADEKLKNIESQEETHRRKLQEFQDADKRGQKLKGQDQLAEAKKVYEPYLTSEIDQIKTTARERVEEIDVILADRERQRKEYDSAKKEVFALLAENRFKEARAKYTPFTGQDYIKEIRDDAQEKIEQLDETRKKSEASDFRAALDKAKSEFDMGSYAAARAELAPYLSHSNEEFRGQARKLDGKVQTYEKFHEQMGKINQLRNAGQYGEALEIARTYAQSENKSFADKGREKVKQIRKERYLDRNLVFIDGGDIAIGSDEPSDRNPAKKVKVKPFYMDRTEVTNAQYAEFVKAAADQPPPLNWRKGRIPKGKDDHPVTWVTYEDALEYCKWRSEKEGVTYRLPTESEWEYAASIDPETGTKTIYPWGDEFDKSMANLVGRKTHSVSSNKNDKSPLGIYDMAGNVHEWTSSDDGSTYIIRGGSMEDAGDPKAARAVFRHKTESYTKAASIGFRCVREE